MGGLRCGPEGARRWRRGNVLPEMGGQLEWFSLNAFLEPDNFSCLPSSLRARSALA